MRTLRLLAATALSGSLLVAVSASSGAAPSEGSKNLRVSHTSLMKNEYFTLYGQVPSTTAQRPLKLQYKSGSAWKTRSTTVTSDEGYFGFEIRTTKSYTWRYYAPRTSAESTVVGYTKKTTVVPQTVSAVVVPSQKCVDDPDTTIQVFAHFSPARHGRDVRLDSAGDTFDGFTDPTGNVILTDTAAPVTRGPHYVTMRASSYNGSAVKTVTAKYTVVECLQ